MYIDIDSPNFNIESLDKDKIFAYYRSVGGLGYSILVRVNGLTLDNFSDTYWYIVNSLGISDVYDRDAVKITQQSILSYDPNLFINNNSFVFDTIETDKNINFHFVPTATLISKKEEHNVAVGTKQNIRYNNLNDFNFDNKEYVEDWNIGLPYVYVSKPFQPLTDGRKRYMLNYIRNFVWLNPTAPFYLILNTAKLINVNIGVEPLPQNIIVKQVESIIKQKNAGTLQPEVKYRKILFSPTSLMTRDEKEKLKGERQSLHCTTIAQTIIYDLIEDWYCRINGKITIRAVADIANLSKTTVCKYWSEFKDIVKSKNDENKVEIKAVKQHQENINKDIIEGNIEPYMADMNVINLHEQFLSDDKNYVIDIDELFESIMYEIQ